jgi:formylglycine-generating enzyme required for sulfatase activity
MLHPNSLLSDFMKTQIHSAKARYLLAFLFFLSVWTDTQAAPAVTNLRASQRPGTHFVDIYYNVATEGNSPLTIHVAVSANRGQSFDVPVFTLSGAAGPGVTPGIDRHIVWNAGVDWGGQFSDQCRVKIIADDGIAKVAPSAPAGFVRIPAGTFAMGSPATEKERDGDETQHTVTLTKDFYMSKHEVTQREYLAVMGNNPSRFTGELNRPVEQVNWNEAMSYCAKLTASEKAAGRLQAGWEYRLPTEAEWEYACRAGTRTPFHYGTDLRSGMANFDGKREYAGGTGSVNNGNGSYLARTTTVGSYVANAFGLYDMHGNVWEWCLDWYGDYPAGSVNDPKGPSSGSVRVIRGGSWSFPAGYCRSAERSNLGNPVNRYFVFGFRPVLAPGQ